MRPCSSTRKQRKGRVFDPIRESHANKCTNVNLEQYVQNCTVLVYITEYNHMIIYCEEKLIVAYLNTY